MPKIQLYDTTLRDGAQREGVSFSVVDKLKIARKLDELGVHFIEGGWPGSNPKDEEFFHRANELKLTKAKLVAFGTTRRANTNARTDANLKALIGSGAKFAAIVGKSSAPQVKQVLETTLKENLSMISDSIDFLKSKGMSVFFDAEHFFDGFKENPEYAIKTLQQAARAGANNLTLCDTNGGTLPHEIRRAILRVKRSLKTPLGIHCHNDGELGVANSIQAVGEGCILVQGTINGYGERCGNANLVSILPILQLKMGAKCFPASKLKELTGLSHYVAEICNMPLLNNQPFTGRSAFAHKGGVHINAMMKNSKTYEHMDPKLIGNHRRFLVSELGGKTNIMLKAKELQLELGKESPETRKILAEIQRLESEGYQFEAAEASFELLVQRMMGKSKKFFDLKSARILQENIGEGSSKVTAVVRAEVKGKQYTAEEDGDGPVNALDKALRKSLETVYPAVKEMHLTDYKVRVVNSSEGTAAKVRVFIESQDKENTWTTVGVDKNVIEASWKALIEAIEYKLLKG